MSDLNATPTASRVAIGLFGRRNAGKSSLLNAITGQQVAVTSKVAGTTTDPVFKSMELLPIGPVVLIDTAGLDDEGELGTLRVEKTYEALRKCHLAVVVCDAKDGITAEETALIDELRRRKIPCVGVLNKSDTAQLTEEDVARISKQAGIPMVCTSATTGEGIGEVKQLITDNARFAEDDPSLVEGLVKAGDIAVLVTPIDTGAPKGRMILPQQQTIRDVLEKDCIAVVAKESELTLTLERLGAPPAVVITDSQAFARVSAETPEDVPLTSFSILFARQKCDLAEMVRGARRVNTLKAGDRVLIVEGCTHHRQKDDIGTVKLPRWITGIAGSGIAFEWASGAHYPRNIADYALIVHCGGCMLNRNEMRYRVKTAREAGVCITNYGVLIAHVLGILPRAVKPFAEASRMLTEHIL